MNHEINIGTFKNKYVTFDNRIHLLSFKEFTNKESALFFTLLSEFNKIKDPNDTLEYSCVRLAELLNLEPKKKLIIPFCKNFMRKIGTLAVEVEKKLGKSMLFSVYPVFYRLDLLSTEKEFKFTVRLNSDFIDLVHELRGNFTSFQLKQYLSIKSVYTQTLYRLLMRWKDVGYFHIGWDEFKEIMCIPDSYKACNINARILYPSIKTLSKFFPNLAFKKHSYKTRKTDEIVFTFDKLPKTPDYKFLSDEKWNNDQNEVKKLINTSLWVYTTTGRIWLKINDIELLRTSNGKGRIFDITFLHEKTNQKLKQIQPLQAHKTWEQNWKYFAEKNGN